jgi:Mycothiol maleylpyruvate isomerase N-terminal domain
MLLLSPIATLPIFPEVNAALAALLEDLTAADWKKPTIHRDRDVKDLVAHLLDGSLRRLSAQRDRHEMDAPEIKGFDELVAHIQELNRAWMGAARRLSPRILIQLMRQADAELVELYAGLDPEGDALYPVAWAGEARSPNWFDVAREYTEKWHHQQQIRDAVGWPGLTERRYLHPVLDTFLRGAPHVYRATDADEGTLVRFTITGDAGGSWYLLRAAGRWGLVADAERAPAAEVMLDADTAWRLWTKGLNAAAARQRAHVNGDDALAAPIFEMVTVMA